MKRTQEPEVGEAGSPYLCHAGALLPHEYEKALARQAILTGSGLPSVEASPVAEVSVPGIDNERLKLHRLGLVALTSKEESVLRRAGEI